MPTIAHLSDLHFGREDPRVVSALIEQLNADPPDLVAISGDFTQRATHGQFAAAARFYSALPEPRLAVPGNHDIPLRNIIDRAFFPLRNFRQYIVQTTRPVLDDGQMCVVGLNTARRLGRRWKGFWKDGILRSADIEFACGTFAKTTSPLRVLVAHHPIQVDQDTFRGDIARNNAKALKQLAAAGCDAILYGHIHVPHTLLGLAEAVQTPRSMLCVMAGTTTSTRLRLKNVNSYNRLWFDGDRCTTDVMGWDGTTFKTIVTKRFVRDGAGRREVASIV